MNITMTIIFFLALSTSVYFYGKLLTWVAWIIKRKNYSKVIADKYIGIYTTVMIISIILWSILFYLLLLKFS